MQVRELAVEGAVEFTAKAYPDDRGYFVSPFQEETFIAATGRPLFPVTQTNVSNSRRGVVRGVHFTVTPPGGAKYVCCVRGRAIDIVVDLRVGSPTFGRWDSVLMDQESFRASYFPLGVGHAFIALEDDTVMNYLVSQSYVPEWELAVSALDPELGLPIPADIDPVMSDRDTVAPTLAEARAAGLLPDYRQCQELTRKLHAID
ncbi:dTDP-4-dehydrorhamnose 3,5-epimerase family protein [Amycolatopsis pigmentata]|uniref:dTDP-4-dehydrorhamnose 3,5-epimerase family protein n=1 Tax=Amycolatopsis pigmentata TaxID=450801 RepID=A0ABW5FN49_9PSEU